MKIESGMKWATKRECEIVALYDMKDYADFLSQASKEKGSWLLNYYRAMCHYAGLGVPEDRQKAETLIKQALRDIKTRADEGNAWAEHCMSRLFELEFDALPQDTARAFFWVERSAEHGFARAQYNLGIRYEFGELTQKDEKHAAELYLKAAEQGVEAAQWKLAKMFRHGGVVAQNVRTSFMWTQRAALQGHALAQCTLGQMYAEGIGVRKNIATALKWLRKSAARGCPEAEWNLALMYERGTGVEKDEATALEWYRKAASHCGS